MKNSSHFPALPKTIHLWLPTTGIFTCLLLLIVANFVNNGILFGNLELYSIMREGWLILIQVIVTLYFVYYSTIYFDHKFGNQFSSKRYIFEIVFVVIIGFSINRFFLFLFLSIIVIPGDNVQLLNTRLGNLLLVSQIMVLLIYILLTGFRILKNFQQKQLEIYKLQKEFTQTEFEALKNQLNPHFLFNSLSALTSLVYADANKAEKFIEKLSGTYRYLLDQREKEAIPISAELNFLDSYQYLIEQRFGNKLIITRNLDDCQHEVYLMPHTFLIILEYIIGTNAMSTAHPLKIEITCNPKMLTIEYHQQTKSAQQEKLLEQFNSLQNNYEQSGNKIRIVHDEMPPITSIRIPLISL